MSKITFEQKKGKSTIINRLSYPETINERIYNAIQAGVFESFLPVSVYKKRKETLIECCIQGLTAFDQYFCGIVTKKMFLDFAHEIAMLIKNCEKNMVSANNIDLESDKIFIDPQTKAVKCIFWPVVNNQRSAPPQIFLKQLPQKLDFNPHENSEYLKTYNAFFSGTAPFSVNNFDRMILKLSGMKSPEGRNVPSEMLTRETREKVKEEQVEKKNIAYDPFAEETGYGIKREIETERGRKDPPQNQGERKLCAMCGERLSSRARFCENCGTKVSEEHIIQAEESGTTVLGGYIGGTVVLGYDEVAEPIYPVLIRLRTEEKFVIDKASFRIGTEQRYCDLFIKDNSYISRSHADIITRDERYFIVDRNSTNKTYIDGKVIPRETEIEIFHKTEIRLANEDFIFSIET